MNTTELVKIIENCFETQENPNFKIETGLLYATPNDVKRVGYCTNLTLDVIEQAKENHIDMILTHHDAWDFIYGLKEACIEKLKLYNISHYFVHLPLDDCSFGTNESLVKKINFETTKKTHLEDGFWCGRVAEVENPISFDELVSNLETVLEEPVRSWKFNDRPVKRIGIVCGGGGLTNHIKESVDEKCDVYITGERVLYSIEYAQFVGMNLIVGSHTFTELFGVESLAIKLDTLTEGIEYVKLNERRIEAIG